MLCRFCKTATAEGNAMNMCKDCWRRYVRVSANKSKLSKASSDAEVAKYTSKLVDDLDTYKFMEQYGAETPKVVAALMLDLEGAPIRQVCAYCGEETDKFHKPTRMCEDCYSLYNNLRTLSHRPRYATARGTASSFRMYLGTVEDRLDAGLKVPTWARSLLEDER